MGPRDPLHTVPAGRHRSVPPDLRHTVPPAPHHTVLRDPPRAVSFSSKLAEDPRPLAGRARRANAGRDPLQRFVQRFELRTATVLEFVELAAPLILERFEF